jgi:hypothetical protein
MKTVAADTEHLADLGSATVPVAVVGVSPTTNGKGYTII